MDLSIFFAPLARWGILLGGTVVFFILGWIWYNPSATPIGKKWVSYFPMPSEMPPPSAFAVMLLLQLFMGFAGTYTVVLLWSFLVEHGLTTLMATLFVLKVFMGFVFIKDLGHWYFERRPFPLILIGVGYWLVGVLGVCGLLMYFW